jgi:chymotrypsin-like protease
MPVVRSAVQVNRLVSFNPSTLRDDISLIKLNASVVVSSSVRPIQLPAASSASTTYLGTILVVSGFGLTTANTVSTNLQYARVVGISLGECRSIYGSVISPNVLCTRGYPNRNSGSCSGDSGGGLVTQNLTTVVGIVSFGASQSCTAGYPQGFTKVAPYLDWINSTVN